MCCLRTSVLFDIESNMFTGDGWAFLPAWLQIEEFYLPNNLITATIPTEIGNLSNLRILEISGTDTSGTIPTEIGNLAMLTSFSSDQSDLHGSIPSEIGRLTNLENFFLRGAQLQGTTIPTEMGQCTNLGKRLSEFVMCVCFCMLLLLVLMQSLPPLQLLFNSPTVFWRVLYRPKLGH